MSLDSMQFCWVPGGDFYMGEGKEQRLNKTLTEDYWLSRFPVTNAQFQEFVKDGGYGEKFAELCWPEAQQEGWWSKAGFKGRYDDELRTAPPYGVPYNLPNHPVVGLSWYEALAFTRWLTERWKNVRAIGRSPLPSPEWRVGLPGEAQWEKAARGGVEIPEPAIMPVRAIGRSPLRASLLHENPHPKRLYPWGDGPADPNLANYDKTGIGATSAVGCFPLGKSPYGCEEMSGNVWEWMEDWWSDEKIYRSLRGGSGSSPGADLRCSARSYANPVPLWPLGTGFRVVCPHLTAIR